MDIFNLSQTESDTLVRDICNKFDRYSDARAAQLDDIQAIRDAIYNTGSKNRVGSNFAIPDIWELAQTLKSHLLENLCSNPEGMFDVAGATLEAQKGANAQKSALVNCFEKMNLQDELEKIINSVVETGEATVFVGWETKTRTVRRVDKNFAFSVDGSGLNTTPNDVSSRKDVNNKTREVVLSGSGEDYATFYDIRQGGALASNPPESCVGSESELNFTSRGGKTINPAPAAGAPQKTTIPQKIAPLDPDKTPDVPNNRDFSPELAFITEEKISFDGPSVKFIPAEDFVFDPERLNSFETAPKIYRSYATVSEIQSNKLNSLLNEQKLVELNNMTSATPNVSSSTSQTPLNDPYSPRAVKGEQIELLEFWGDLSVNGKNYPNMLAVVAGRKQIIRLEQNPFITQPFIHASIITDPRTSRGVSPLKIALGLSEIASNILNKQLDALSLIINPPYLAPKGCFKGEQLVSPGKIIEYDAALMPNQPIPLNFNSALRGWDFINFFKTSIESATGIYKTMAGNLSAPLRTATEINYSAAGQSARLNMIIDAISRKIIIPIVEKTAQTLANFKLGDEQIAVKHGGNINFITVSDSVRCDDYVYYYGDKRATLERKYRFKELFDIVSQFAQRDDFVKNIDLVECFKFALEQYGIENPSKFLSRGV